MSTDNDWSRDAWESNAAFWDGRMAEGNSFFKLLIWPAVERMLPVHPVDGQPMRILDVACGNGITTRKLAALGAQVLGIDFAAEMLHHAQQRGLPAGAPGSLEYHLLDATNEAALLALGEQAFDAALCNMALFDMAEIHPLFRALARLLKPAAPFVFSIVHPSFNSARFVKVMEEEDLGDEIATQYAIKVYTYMTAAVHPGVAMRGQPKAQPYFHRPLQAILAAGFEAGFVLDALEERAYPPDAAQHNDPLIWGPNFSEIPPVMVARMRRDG